MKHLNITLMVIIFGLAAVFSSCVIFMTAGNGNLISAEKKVSSFNKINSGGSAQVRYHKSQEYRVVITTDSNLIDFVTANVRNNTLYLGTKSGSFSFTSIYIDVYCPVITGITLSGSGSFNSNETISVSLFESHVSGSGKIEGTFDCTKFNARISGSGRITVYGNSNDSNITISGSGRFNGNAFSVKNATVHVSGSGNANVLVTDNLSANISGSGSINYYGSPKLSSSVSGSGRIRKM